MVSTGTVYAHLGISEIIVTRRRQEMQAQIATTGMVCMTVSKQIGLVDAIKDGLGAIVLYLQNLPQTLLLLSRRAFKQGDQRETRRCHH